MGEGGGDGLQVVKRSKNFNHLEKSTSAHQLECNEISVLTTALIYVMSKEVKNMTTRLRGSRLSHSLTVHYMNWLTMIQNEQN